MKRAAAVLAALLVPLIAVVPGPAVSQEGPTTEFEDSNGAAWTSFDGEQSFLTAVDATSERVTITEIGRTVGDRPLQLVALGEPAPRSVEEIRDQPTIFYSCTVHGNEPAGREACLMAIRDLALTDDPALVELLQSTTLLFEPTANPDGRAANTRGNADGVDVNRDHLNLATPEARAIATVLRDYQPDATIDLHEYGGSPVVYDDDVLVLWPRNLNVDREVYELARSLALDWISAGVEEAGYTADEYGLFEAGGQDITQAAGDEDEGILRNLGGLRHSLGILVETSVNPRLINPPDPSEVEPAATMRRRVGAHRQVITETLEFMAAQGRAAMAVTAGAVERKTAEGRDRSAPAYFGGQDQDSTIDGSGPPPAPEEIVDPPPCAYRLTAAQFDTVAPSMELLGMRVNADPDGDGAIVPMGQPAEPLIHLLLDARGRRNAFLTPDGQGEAGEALDDCTGLPLELDGGVLIDRVGGDERVETAALVAAAAAPASSTVVVATAGGYADALAAGPLARHLDAALLLSERAALSQATADEIVRRGATDAVIVGGEAALSAQVEEDLDDLGLAVRRIGGSSRFATAALLFDEFAEGSDAVVVEGEHADAARGWPDALSGGALAGLSERGVLLVTHDRLPEETAGRLGDDVDVTIVGGDAAVSEAIAAQIRAIAGDVNRIEGANRYATSAAAADAALAAGASPAVVWLATGRDWPDGLAAGAAGGPVLLVDGEDLSRSPEALGWLQAHAEEIAALHLVGGSSAISSAVEQELREALQ